MKKRQKKGFTIVELVVVIAVIAILAAVLIPTFVNLIHKAEFNSDQALVKNINTTLAISAEGRDGKPTMYETLVEVQKNGYVIENLTPRSSGSEIVWDADHNQFVLVYKDKNNQEQYFTGTQWNTGLNKKHMWKIYNTVPTDSVYSVYLTGTTYNQAVSVKGVGFDAGRNTNIPSVTYSNKGEPQNVTIRTNGYDTNLIVDDETTGTIYHHGVAGSIEIIECHTSSFHEYGKVAFAEISKGRIVLESGSEVNHIHVNAKEDDNGNKLDEFDTVVIAKASSVDMPDLSRDDVEIATAGTLVVALQEGTNVNDDKDYVWLTKQGVFEQITISDKANSATSTTGVVWANDNSVSETNQTAAQQIANNIGRGATGAVSATVTVGETEYKVTLDTTTRELVLTNTTTNQVETNSQVVTDAVAEAVETPKTAEEMKEEAIAAVVVNITSSVETLGDGETFQLVATGSNLAWSSSDSDVATVSQTGLLTATGVGSATITVTDGDQVKTCDVTVTYFHGGEGTNTVPYVIVNEKQMTNISKFSWYYYAYSIYYGENGFEQDTWGNACAYADTTNYKDDVYYAVADDVDEIDMRGIGGIYMSGHLNGNGVTFKNVNKRMFYITEHWDNDPIVFDNFTIEANIVSTGWTSALAYSINGYEVTVKNVNITGIIQGAGVASYLTYGSGYNSYNTTTNFINCTSSASLISTTQGASGFIANAYNNEATNGKVGACSINLYNSKFDGTMDMASGKSANYICVNTGGYESTVVTDDNENASTYYTLAANAVLKVNTPYTKANSVSKTIQTETIDAPEAYSTFSVTKASTATTCTATLFVGPNDKNEKGNYTGVYMVENCQIEGDTFVTSNLKNFDITINGDSTTTTGISSDGNTYNIVSVSYGSTYGSAMVQFVEKDASGKIVLIINVNVKR